MLAAGSCSFSWGDEFARTIGPVEVKLEEDEIVITSQKQPLFNILAGKLCLFLCKSLCANLPSFRRPAHRFLVFLRE